MNNDILIQLGNLSPDLSSLEIKEAYWKGFADATFLGPDSIDEHLIDGLEEIANLLASQFVLVSVPHQHEETVVGEYLTLNVGGSFHIMPKSDLDHAMKHYNVTPVRSL